MQRLVKRGSPGSLRRVLSLADPTSLSLHSQRLEPAPRCRLAAYDLASPAAAAARASPTAAAAAAMAQPAPPAPAGTSRTFYRRELPPPAVEFSSAGGRALFGAALAAGTMNSYFRLAEHYGTQDEPAFCGLASVSMVLNTLAIDPRRAWKGPWRFFHEQMLDCCHPLVRLGSA
jgi:hypothetical protein